MNFLDKLNILMSEKGLNKSTLSKTTGIPYTTIDGWYKKGYGKAKLSSIEILANYFDTTLDYLMREDVTDRDYGRQMDKYVSAEQNLLDLWHNATIEGQQAAIVLLKGYQKDAVAKNVNDVSAG